MSNQVEGKSPTTPADAVSLVAHYIPDGAVAAGFDGLDQENHAMSVREVLTANPVYPVNNPPAAEAKDAPPVASGTDWFELGASLVLEGRITETRFRRAVDAVRKGVDRE